LSVKITFCNQSYISWPKANLVLPYKHPNMSKPIDYISSETNHRLG